MAFVCWPSYAFSPIGYRDGDGKYRSRNETKEINVFLIFLEHMAFKEPKKDRLL